MVPAHAGVERRPGLSWQTVGWVVAAGGVFMTGLPFYLLWEFWTRLGQANSPVWVGLVVLLCYGTIGVALLSVGRGLATGADRLIWRGINLLFAAVGIALVLFVLYD